MGSRDDSGVVGVCYGIAVAEIIFFIAYIVTQSRRLRKKIISMGRLIPSVPLVVVVPGQVAQQTNIQAYPPQYPPQSQYSPPQQNVQVCPQYPPQSQYPQSQESVQVCPQYPSQSQYPPPQQNVPQYPPGNIQIYPPYPPPQPGFQPPQDYPPPYTEKPQK